MVEHDVDHMVEHDVDHEGVKILVHLFHLEEFDIVLEEILLPPEEVMVLFDMEIYLEFPHKTVVE